MYILVIDDDVFANTLHQFALTKEGYEVETVDNSRGALQMISRREPDLLVLDVTMPYLDGFQLAEKLTADGWDIPYIFLTAQDDLEAKLHGFQIGAQDYICKPFNHQEVAARVRAVIRRLAKERNLIAPESCIRVGKVELRIKECKVILQETVIPLTRIETAVLQNFMMYPNQVIERQTILNTVWNDPDGNSNMVNVCIRRLRMKIETEPNHPRYIISVRGLGYTFCIEENKEEGRAQ
jgi:DNA-binding response OmpR family regulator